MTACLTFLCQPQEILLDVFKKMDFLSLSRLRRTCKIMDNLVENQRSRLARKVSQFDFYITVMNSKIEYEVSNLEMGNLVKVKVSNPFKSFSGIGFYCVYLETKENYNQQFEHNQYKDVMALLETMNLFARSLQVIDFPVEESLRIISVPKIIQNLHLRYTNYYPNEKAVFIQVLSDERIKAQKWLSLEIGGLYRNLPSEVMNYVIHNEVLTLQLVRKENISTILWDMKKATDFGNLQLLTGFLPLPNYDESEIVFPPSKSIFMDNSETLPYGFTARSVSVLDTSTKHILISEGFYLNPIQTNIHFRYFSVLLLPKITLDEVFDANKVSSLSSEVGRIQELWEIFPTIDWSNWNTYQGCRVLLPASVLMLF